ncbi:hypothetical protein GCM10010214_61610 [Streptomyces abikoensis]|nr:hypothetical protein GCM10010214_61610 [Streptomyces abikoensis]
MPSSGSWEGRPGGAAPAGSLRVSEQDTTRSWDTRDGSRGNMCRMGGPVRAGRAARDGLPRRAVTQRPRRRRAPSRRASGEVAGRVTGRVRARALIPWYPVDRWVQDPPTAATAPPESTG